MNPADILSNIPMRPHHSLLLIIALTISAAPGAEWAEHTIQTPVLKNIPSAVANDWNKDGKVDVISSWGGRVVLYRAPDWRAQTIHTFDPKDSRTKPRPACIHSCLIDADGDGDLDLCGSNQTVFWLECPDDPFGDKPWVYRTVDDEILGTHCLITGDVNRDGRLDLIANSGRDAGATEVPNSIVWLEIPADPRGAKSWIRHVFADRDAPGASHYMGFGDVNGDGRPDIACAAKGGERYPGGEWFAWWEQPDDPASTWKKHVLANDQVGASNIIPADLDGDGKIDYAASRGHGKGVLWFKGPDFKQIEIDPDIAFPHSLAIADIDADGDADIATCGKEADGNCVWYENDGKGKFQTHLVAADQGSYDLRILDMDGDGDLDFLIAGQASRNIVWLENPGL